MITELTPEQIGKFPEYVAKYVALGRTTEQQKLEDAIIDFSLFQKKILRRKPAPVVLLSSLTECWIAVLLSFFKENIKDKKIIEDSDWATLEDNKTIDLWKSVYKELSAQTAGQAPCKPGKKSKQFDPNISLKTLSNVKFIWPYFDCQFFTSFFGFYDFCAQELGIKLLKKYYLLRNCMKYGMVFPMNSLCIVCQPFTEIHIRNGNLHHETRPALSYNGITNIYCMNGVAIPPKYILTPAAQLDVKEILAEPNVEVRRELIRKIGIEQFLAHLPHKIIDKKNGYELLDVELSPMVKNARYLKMNNPSIGTWHVEAVEGSTVQEALDFRASRLKLNDNWNPAVLT